MERTAEDTDYIVVGAGIVGLSIARVLKRRFPTRRVIVIDKESEVAFHASGRNSGVLHAGFYYSAESLKAKFTRDGNRALQNYCQEKGLKIRRCGKVVVASSAEEIEVLDELKKRGDRNGVPLECLDDNQLKKINRFAKSFKKALFSPETAVVNPKEVCLSLQQDLLENGVEVRLSTSFLRLDEDKVQTSAGPIKFKALFNASGLYADRIAKEFGFGLDYIMLPFKGLYLKDKNTLEVPTHIYPVPDLKCPFLGVHYTITVDGDIKLGPTAVPALWRENYAGVSRFSLQELVETAYFLVVLFAKNRFRFRLLVFTELKKYFKGHFQRLSMNLVNTVLGSFQSWSRPGIRAQLLNKKTLELVQDFIIEGDSRSIHVLNAVSPGMTCAFPIAEYVVDFHVRQSEPGIESQNDLRPNVEKFQNTV